MSEGALAESLLHALATRLSHGVGPARTVIAVAGESGSGKSTTALALAQALERAQLATIVLHQDDYFVRPPATNHAHRGADIRSVGPQEVDFPLLNAHVETFRRGDCIPNAPKVDYPGNRFVAQRVDCAGAVVLVVEGTYVIAHVVADIRVFLAASFADTLEGRRARNRDVDSPFVEEVLAIEHGIVAAQAALADIVIDANYAIVERKP